MKLPIKQQSQQHSRGKWTPGKMRGSPRTDWQPGKIVCLKLIDNMPGGLGCDTPSFRSIQERMVFLRVHRFNRSLNMDGEWPGSHRGAPSSPALNTQPPSLSVQRNPKPDFDFLNFPSQVSLLLLHTIPVDGDQRFQLRLRGRSSRDPIPRHGHRFLCNINHLFF